ncbi:MAG: energy-coupling factor ABC transporter substrate-binding protein [Candidatus Micrarchaeota archaeon]
MDDKIKYALALLAIIAIFALPFFVNPGAKFSGSDDAGSQAIQAQAPGYVRWVMPLWTPPPETESMLFALQAALGALVIGYFIGYEKARADLAKGKDRPDGENRKKA